MGIAELHEAGTLGVLHHAALERDGAQLVGLSAARPHAGLLLGVLGKLLGVSAATDKRARGAVVCLACTNSTSSIILTKSPGAPGVLGERREPERADLHLDRKAHTA